MHIGRRMFGVLRGISTKWNTANRSGICSFGPIFAVSHAHCTINVNSRHAYSTMAGHNVVEVCLSSFLITCKAEMIWKSLQFCDFSMWVEAWMAFTMW